MKINISAEKLVGQVFLVWFVLLFYGFAWDTDIITAVSKQIFSETHQIILVHIRVA